MTMTTCAIVQPFDLLGAQRRSQYDRDQREANLCQLWNCQTELSSCVRVRTFFDFRVHYVHGAQLSTGDHIYLKPIYAGATIRCFHNG